MDKRKYVEREFTLGTRRRGMKTFRVRATEAKDNYLTERGEYELEIQHGSNSTRVEVLTLREMRAVRDVLDGFLDEMALLGRGREK